MAIKNYVNMETVSATPAFGRKIECKTKINVRKPVMVYIILVPDPKNKDPKKLKLENRAGIDSPGRAMLAKMTESDGTVRFDLFLSTYANDKFSVKVAKEKKGHKGVKETGVTHEVWKKLYYQTSKMKASFDFPFGRVLGEYKKHNIELEATRTEIVPYKENLETDDLAAYRAYFKKTKTPFEAHIVLIDRQCDAKRFSSVGEVTAQKTFITIPPDKEHWPFQDWIVNTLATDTSGKTATPTLTRTTRNGKKGIEIDLSSSGLDFTTAPVTVGIEYKVLAGEYTGDASFPPNVFIAVGKPRSDESKSKTVAHEIGHAVGMVPTRGHILQYSNANGGMGSHCHYGADPDQKSIAQGGTFAGQYTNGTCVMYAYSSEHYTFCDTCKEFVREADLTKDKMKNRGWG
ncbi:MAG: hypothetical protein HY080_00415 [Gammaproteobacteria bacterium]|nr:hypothetical protein [Gammaproteobacteria bacterium]